MGCLPHSLNRATYLKSVSNSTKVLEFWFSKSKPNNGDRIMKSNQNENAKHDKAQTEKTLRASELIIAVCLKRRRMAS